MTITLGQIIAWLLLGAIAGAIVNFATRRRRGIGMSIILGLVGAVIGGILFALLNISVAPNVFSLQILDGSINFTDVVAAVVGALIVVLAARAIR